METMIRTTTTLEPPKAPRQWSLEQIETALSRPLPKGILKTKKLGGREIAYLPWYAANRILTKYCPGWSFEIVHLQTTSDRLILTGRLTIPTSEGNVYRDATGTEELTCSNYGDPSSNAESMAFRRCCARFGLGLGLYEK